MLNRRFTSKREMINYFFLGGKPKRKVLSQWQIFKAKFGLIVEVGAFEFPNFSEPTRHYLFKCNRCHKLSIDHFHTNNRLDCHRHNSSTEYAVLKLVDPTEL